MYNLSYVLSIQTLHVTHSLTHSLHLLQRPRRQSNILSSRTVPLLNTIPHGPHQLFPHQPLTRPSPHGSVHGIIQIFAVPEFLQIRHHPRLRLLDPIVILPPAGRAAQRRRSSRQDMDARAHGPDISLRGMERGFRGVPRGRAHEPAFAGSRLGGREAEVGEDEVRVRVGSAAAAGPEEDVGGLDVAVHDGLELLRRGRAVVGGAVVARVDVGEGVGELHVRMPDEGFGDLGAAFGVGINQILEVTVGAPLVPECRAGRGVGVGL